jgi:tetratricopeptide (TPR) repeat protein
MRLYRLSRVSLCKILANSKQLQTLLNFGENYQENNQYQTAILFFIEASKVAKEIPDPEIPKDDSEYGFPRNLASDFMSYEIQTMWARGGVDSSVRYAKKTPSSKYYWCYALYRAATCCQKTGEFHKAIEILEPNLEVLRTLPGINDDVFKIIGHAYLMNSDGIHNKENLTKAVNYFKESNPDALSNYNLACCYCLLGKFHLAKKKLKITFRLKNDGTIPSIDFVLSNKQLDPIRDWIRSQV